MRVLVTGGSGFIGSHVVDRLRERDLEPVIFDLRHSLYHSSDDVETLIGSVTDPETLEIAIAGCDAVIHLAAVADVNDVVKDPAHAENVNARGTLNVLEAARQAETQRVVYGSTIWAYSDCVENTVDEDTPLGQPSHFYTATKLAGEMYCRSYAELYGIDFTILRFGIPYGPRAREAAVIPAFVNRALAGQPLTLAGDGKQFRRFVYVQDLASGIVSALANGHRNRVYNLASDETVTILEIAQTVQEVVGDVGITHTEARAGDFGGKVVSSERAARELDWAATTSFGEGVRQYVEWRREREQERPRRVLVLTADIGAGHDLPAERIADQLRDAEPDVEVSVVDGLAAMGRPIQMLIRDGSDFTLNHLPWLFGIQYFLLMRLAPVRWLALRLGTLVFGRRMLKLIRRHDPDAVVSTYPGATALIGELRQRRRLELPCYSAITDLAGLYFWAHPGIDLHFVTHPESIAEVERIAGEGSARWAGPPSDARFMTERSQAGARDALELPAEGKVVVVSGGGWGIGDLRGAIETALAHEDATVVCICGHNERLQRKLADDFGTEPRLRLLGFTDEMSDLLAAADALVHSTAGLTVLEAIVRGCPVVSYGFGAGHVGLNNRALERFGLAQVARDRKQLTVALKRALVRRPAPDLRFEQLSSPAKLLLGQQARRKATLPLWRLRLGRATAMAAASFLALTAVFASDDSYTLIAKAFHVKPVTSVSTNRREVGLMVNAPADLAAGVAVDLGRHRDRSSFALRGTPPDELMSTLARHGDEAVPQLNPGGPVRWLGTKFQLRHAKHEFGLKGHFYYAVPGKGFTLGQYLLGKTSGAKPVGAAVHLTKPDQIDNLEPGDIVEADYGNSMDDWNNGIDLLTTELRGSGLRAVPVGVLFGGSD